MSIHNKHHTHITYRADIDGLRAIAVLSVIGYHAFPEFIHGGFIGVDIFFVISGYLISSIILSDLVKNNFSVKQFYIRRIRRIFPALLLVLTSSIIAGGFILMTDEYRMLSKYIAAGASFLTNFTSWHEAENYFDSAAETKPLLHLWSLAVEEQFYIFWPLILAIVWRSKLNFIILTLIVTATSFSINIYTITQDPAAAFYLPIPRFWELMIGSLLAYITLHHPHWNDHHRNIQSVIGLILLTAGFLLINKSSAFPGWWALLPTLGAVLLISGGASAWLNRLVLSNKIAVRFGLISYPLYLWHWPLLSFAQIMTGDILSTEIRIVIVLTSILFATLTYKFIEQPIRFNKTKRTPTRTLVLFMVLLGCFGYYGKTTNILPTTSNAPAASQTPTASNVPSATHLTDVLGYDKCPETLLDGITFGWCLMNPKGNMNAAMIGDSHAEDKFIGIARLDKSKNWMLLASSSCPPVYGVSVIATKPGCQEKSEATIQWLVKSDGIKTVMLAYYGNYFLTTSYAADHVKNKLGPESIKISSKTFDGETRRDMFYRGLDKTITMLEQSHKKIILAIDIPELPFLPQNCVKTQDANCHLAKQQVAERQLELRTMISQLKSNHPSLLIFDPIRLYCPNKACKYKDNKQNWYRDSHHLTVYGSDIYAEKFMIWSKKTGLNNQDQSKR